MLSGVNTDCKDRRIIQNLYRKQTTNIVTTTGISGELEVKRGAKQGCVLSTVLFNLYTDKIFKDDLAGVLIAETI